MQKNKIQFAMVREDPQIEAEILRFFNCQKVLLVASGGCTAFCLNYLFPSLKITAIDQNPAQIKLIQAKHLLLKHPLTEKKHEIFNIENDASNGLNACGNFESLFRCFRYFISEFILDKNEIKAMFCDDHDNLKIVEKLFRSPYWPAAFDVYFHDSILKAMFGPAAVQHANAGSYPSYFRGALEKGLRRPNSKDNYFLQHIFLGYYLDRKSSLPTYLQGDTLLTDINLVVGDLTSVNDLDTFDLVSVSNIFDWMSTHEVELIGQHLCQNMKKGSVILYRQLNNKEDFSVFFRKHFKFEDELSNRLLNSDRSLFYEKISIGVKI